MSVSWCLVLGAMHHAVSDGDGVDGGEGAITHVGGSVIPDVVVGDCGGGVIRICGGDAADIAGGDIAFVVLVVVWEVVMIVDVF